MRQAIPLNALEKFMLAHESEDVSYNSQLCIEFSGESRSEELKSAVDEAIKSMPLLRSYIIVTPLAFKRFYHQRSNYNSNEIVLIEPYLLTSERLDEFCNKKFQLDKEAPFKFLLSKTETGKNILIFNVHHTLCDAAGQFHILEEIFRLMNGLPIRQGAMSKSVFQYRSLWKYMGWKWFAKHFFENFKPLSKQRQYKMATLVDHPHVKKRYVTSFSRHLSLEEQQYVRATCKKYEISITEYLTYCSFKALDKSLKRRGDHITPIMVYLPKTLRPLLKIRYSLQNILTTVLIVGKRDEIYGEKFLGKVKHIITTHKMDKAAKFIFGSLWFCSFMRPTVLRKFFKDLDQNPDSITSTLLISAGLVPRSFTFPAEWNDLSVWARGNMLKSPGVGVIFTGIQGSETITFEYVKDLSDRETVEFFCNDLMNELLQI